MVICVPVCTVGDITFVSTLAPDSERILSLSDCTDAGGEGERLRFRSLETKAVLLSESTSEASLTAMAESTNGEPS